MAQDPKSKERKSLSSDPSPLFPSEHPPVFRGMAPSKATTPSTTSPSMPKRNTLNQRASRARRKTYIDELELKVRGYELEGVKVTEQVQVAARRVAEENRALREEVRVLRELNAELDRRLSGRLTLPRDERGRTAESSHGRGGDGEAAHQAPDFQALSRHLRTTSQVQPGERCSPRPHSLDIQTAASPPSPRQEHRSPYISTPASNSATANFDSDLDLNSNLSVVAGPLPSPSSLENKRDTAPSECYNLESPAYSASSASNSSPPPRSMPSIPACRPNSTSCAQAALIIASMRGLPATDVAVEAEILPELGCESAVRVGGVDAHSKARRCGGVERGDAGNRSISSRGARGHGDTSCNPKGCSYQEARYCTVDNARLFGILDS